MAGSRMDEGGDRKDEDGGGEPAEADEREEFVEEARLFDLLERLRLKPFAAALRELGVESVGDLAYLQDADLERLSMPMIPRRKLLEAAGGDWRSTAATPRPVAAPPEPAAPAVAAKAEEGDVEAAAVAAVAEGDPDEEVAQLVRDAERLIDDFCAANELGGPARTELLGISPRIALRAIGLIGRGNAFVMQGVRRPSAAARSRVRAAAAAEAEGGERSGGQPYEDWRRLLEGFAQVNGLPMTGASTAVWDSLRNLERADALRVMGFTSGLSFMMHSDAGESVEEQVTARVEAVLGGGASLEKLAAAQKPSSVGPRPPWRGGVVHGHASAAAPPGAPSAPGAPPRRAAPGGREAARVTLSSARNSPGRTVGPPACSRSRSSRRSSSHSRRGRRRRSGSSSSGSSGSRRSLRRKPPPPPPRRRPSRGRGRSRSRSRSRSRRRPAASSTAASGGGGDGAADTAPHWQRNVDDFVHVNELDERSSRALADLPKPQALQVMGLIGRENSFVIRNARNTSAAVMHRLAKVQEMFRARGNAPFDDAEPFAQLPKLIEDFIFVNNFDERGVEAMRTLRPDVALQVMGFTAENAFLVRGVKNPSAALIARIAIAQRRPGRGGGHQRG